MRVERVISVFVLFIVFCLSLSHAANANAASATDPVFAYTRDQLISLRQDVPEHSAVLSDIPAELRRGKTKRGCRGGAKVREKRVRKGKQSGELQRRRYKPYLPSVVMGNVRSLDNKMDELTARVRNNREFRECSLMCFTETWMHERIPDSAVDVAGFSSVRADRTRRESGKSKGGGLAVFVNERWCHPNHIVVKERVCSPDIELLAVGLRPYYLPREFSHVIAIVVYIPPSANATTACDVIHSVTAGLQTMHQDAFVLILGDFNHVSLNRTLLTFSQFVDCPTRGNKTLDLLYANVKEAYSCTAIPPLGRSDHNLVYLQPTYLPLVKRQPATVRIVREWSKEASAALQDCMETTDWEVLCEPHGVDIDNLTDCVTEYINFCVDCTVPVKSIRCFPNNKPWVTKDIKALLNEKKKAFRLGDKEAAKEVQRRLTAKLKEGKDRYRKKLEQDLQQNNSRYVWRGMKNITGFKTSSPSTDGDVERANQFNLFFNRFDSRPLPSFSSSTTAFNELSAPASSTSVMPNCSTSSYLSPSPSSIIYRDSLSNSFNLFSSSSPIIVPTTASTSSLPAIVDLDTHKPSITITEDQVRRELRRLHPAKAPGPDGLTTHVLKLCASQLSGVLLRIFNLSLSIKKVPVLWKTSCLVPVPKKARPNAPSDYRPVALTSHSMKVFERLVLDTLRPLVRSAQDSLQFAYQAKIGVEDAIIYLLYRAYSHLDKPGASLRITFFDFSSAFNTIQPARLGSKLSAMQVHAPLVAWIMDYLTDRPQYVRLQGCKSDTVLCSTGAPQGTVLSPLLFTLYTSDFQYNTEGCHLQKFSDDSAIVGCIKGGDDLEYRMAVNSFVDWCELNQLKLNIQKTKELVVDLRRSRPLITPLSIRGVDVEIVQDYKYLGVHIDNKLDWSKNSLVTYRRGQSRLYFLRRLRSFRVCNIMLRMFYESVVASAIFYAVVCWGGSMKVADMKRLNKLIRKAGSVVGEELDNMETVVERRTLSRLRSIMDNEDHPLYNVVDELRSTFSHRFTSLKCSTERHRKSFLPTAIRLYNSSLSHSPSQ